MCFSYIQKKIKKIKLTTSITTHYGPVPARPATIKVARAPGPSPSPSSPRFPNRSTADAAAPRYPVPTAAPATCHPKVRPLLLLLLLSYPSPRFTDVERRRPLACRAAGVLLRPREESLLPHQGPHPGRCCPPPSPSRSRSATAARGHNGMQQEEGEAARAAQR